MSDPTQPLNEGIGAALDTWAAYVTLTPGGTHKTIADEGIKTPHLVFTKLPGPPRRYTFGGVSWVKFLYSFHAYAQNSSADDGQSAANKIVAQVELALTSARLSVAGWNVGLCQPIGSGEEFATTEKDEVWFHAVQLYDIHLTPA